ncbi:MAG TPA: phosphonate metabolism transcriptional regulator PhnF [Rhodocyclaceae bacterium]
MSAALDRSGGVALWRQIESRLEEAIAGGRYAAGRLPSAQQLADEFGVNRHTVRQALQGLQERGLVRLARGREASLRHAAIEYSLGERPRFSRNLAQQNLAGRFRVIAAGEAAAPPEAAKALGVRVGSTIERVETVGLADDVPISAAVHYFPARLAGIGEALRGTASVTRALARFGIDDYVRKWTRITAELPDTAIADRLEMGEARPILLAKALNVDAAGHPVQYSETAFCAERVQLVVGENQPASAKR